MKLQLALAFVTLLINAPTTTMEYLPSFKFVGTTKKVTSLRAVALQHFNQTKVDIFNCFRFRKEVERIIKSGSTVQQTETQKLRKAHKKILKDYKKCVKMNDAAWNEFVTRFENVRTANPLFKKLTPQEYAALLQEVNKTQAEAKTEKQKFEAKAKHDIFLKLQERGLNPAAVKIDFENEQFAAARQETKLNKSNQFKISNILELGKAHASDSILLSSTYNH